MNKKNYEVIENRGICESCDKLTVVQIDNFELSNSCLTSKGYLKYGCSQWVKREPHLNEEE